MRIRQLAAVLFLGVLIAGTATMLAPQVVHAQCGLVGQPPCPPKKRPTATEPRSTRTPTSTPTPSMVFVPQSTGQGGTLMPPADQTFTAFALTYLPCYHTIFPPAYKTAAAALTQSLNDWSYWAETTADAAVDRCMTGTPMPPTPLFIPPTAGPVFLRPGVKNVLILVMIIGVLFTGGVLIARVGKKTTK